MFGPDCIQNQSNLADQTSKTRCTPSDAVTVSLGRTSCASQDDRPTAGTGPAGSMATGPDPVQGPGFSSHAHMPLQSSGSNNLRKRPHIFYAHLH